MRGCASRRLQRRPCRPLGCSPRKCPGCRSSSASGRRRPAVAPDGSIGENSPMLAAAATQRRCRRFVTLIWVFALASLAGGQQTSPSLVPQAGDASSRVDPPFAFGGNGRWVALLDRVEIHDASSGLRAVALPSAPLARDAEAARRGLRGGRPVAVNPRLDIFALVRADGAIGVYDAWKGTALWSAPTPWPDRTIATAGVTASILFSADGSI